jgi:two-component SAPR family response regulator
MNLDEALKLIDNALNLLPLKRSEHLLLMEAIKTVADYIKAKQQEGNA